MEYINLYDKIDNPLDNPEVLQSIVKAYSECATTNKSFYSRLVRRTKKNGIGSYYRDQADKYYSTIFNLWKKNIVDMTKEEFKNLYSQGKLQEDFITLRQFLKTLPDVKTQQEANEIMYGINYDDKLLDAMDKYRWTAFGEGTGWTHVSSHQIKSKREDKRRIGEIGHRLYINIESLDLYEILNSFTDKCIERNIPFYYKFNMYCDRDESIVFYSSTENLETYLNILEEVKKEHQSVVTNAKNPPVLTGVIDNWIGYGSEPMDRENGNGRSFNDLRANILGRAISMATEEWILLNYEKEVNYNGTKMTFEDYFNNLSTTYMTRKLKEKIKNKTDKEAVDSYGYKMSDIDNTRVKERIFKLLKSKMTQNLMNSYNQGFKEIEPIEMEVRKGKKVEFDSSDLEYMIQFMTGKISDKDNNFIYGVKKKIEEIAPTYGVDANKFCYDIMRREELRKHDAIKLKDYALDEMVEKTDELKIPRERLNHETDEEYENYLKEFYEKGTSK